jgi:hypothetical protein
VLWRIAFRCHRCLDERPSASASRCSLFECRARRAPASSSHLRGSASIMPWPRRLKKATCVKSKDVRRCWAKPSDTLQFALRHFLMPIVWPPQLAYQDPAKFISCIIYHIDAYIIDQMNTVHKLSIRSKSGAFFGYSISLSDWP